MVDCTSHIQNIAEFMKLSSNLPTQALTSNSWFTSVILYCHQTYAHPTIVSHQTVVVVHAMQNGAQMHMTFDIEVTHIICYSCECHPIIVEDVVKSLYAGGYNTLLLIKNIAWLYSNSIPIVYSKWLKDSNS